MSETIELLVKNAANHGEGPHWDDTNQCLYYVDSLVGDIKRYDAVKCEDSRLDLTKSVVSIVIPRQQGGFIVTHETEVATVESWDSGKITTFAKVESDPNALNDGKVDASGRLWLGSCYYGGKVVGVKDWPKERGSLYSIDPDGAVKKHVDKISISNGMDWSDDNRIMYYIDSKPRQVWAFDFDIEAGTIICPIGKVMEATSKESLPFSADIVIVTGNKRTVADFSNTEIPDLGYPDGMTVDTDGKLWVACFDAGKVVRVDPETGKVIHVIKFPVSKITSCCFGGKDFSDLYVTSSKLSMTPEDVTRVPLSGTLFKVTGLGVKGRKANMFAG